MATDVRQCECGGKGVLHETHFYDERIYHTRKKWLKGKLVKVGAQTLMGTAERQLLFERWYCMRCGALLQERGSGAGRT